jgi:hypothetical protein
MASPASKYWEIIADNLSKAGWSWAVFLPSILAGEQPSLKDESLSGKSL